ATVAPSNTYPCSDGGWVVIGGNSEPIFRRLMTMIDRPELADSPHFRTNVERVAHAAELDEIIGAWTSRHPLAEVLARLDEHDVPSGPIYTAAEIAQDAQYREREAVVAVPVTELGRMLTMQGILPKFAGTPGSIRWTGPALGEHNQEVLGGLLNFSAAELQALKEQGVI
ncbi:MAG: CoA transferase, partial [Anaerolineae bacterium]